MLKQRRTYAEAVAAALFEAEDAIDAAIAKAAALSNVMVAGRAGAGLSAVVGQDAVAQSAQTLALLSQARGAIVTAHNELGVCQKQIGLGAIAGSSGGDKTATTGHLQDVSRAA